MSKRTLCDCGKSHNKRESERRCHAKQIREADELRLRNPLPPHQPPGFEQRCRVEGYTDGIQVGYLKGKLHTAVMLLGECEEYALLSNEQGQRLLQAAAVVNSIYNALGAK